MIAADPSVPPRALRIFLVENHADTLRWFTKYLEQMGHTVLSADSMKAALAGLGKADVDVLISDIGLPDGSGWDLLKEAHLQHPVYAIAMSGMGMNKDRAKSREAGYRHHMLKPFDPDELEGMLAEAGRELDEAGKAA